MKHLTVPTTLIAGLCLFTTQAAFGQDLSDGAKRAAKQSNAFAYDLYNELKGEQGNLFFSPYSISSALTMTWAGAKGQTAAEMARVLHLGDQPADVTHDALGDLLKHLNGPPAQAPAEKPTTTQKPDKKLRKPGKARGARGALQQEQTGEATLFGQLRERMARLRKQIAEALQKAAEEAKKQQGDRLSVANGIWPDRQAPLLPEYVKTLQQRYGAGVEQVDYQTDPQGARKRINEWVEQQTNDKIKDLLPEPLVTTDTRLILTNAIYFKGSWKSEFKKDATKPGPWTNADGSTTEVPVMTQKADFFYGQTPELKVLDLPYKDGQRSMTIFLPNAADGLAAVEAQLVSGKLDALLKDRLFKTEVDVRLPKFKLELEQKLKKTLVGMPATSAARGQPSGMPSAFGPLADFSGMNGKKNLRISEVVHKAFVDVNEEGTEAAAATAVVVGIESAVLQPKTFHATHPFVFMIRDKTSGAILFLGRVANPNE